MSNKAVLSCRNLGKSYDEGPQSVEVLSGDAFAAWLDRDRTGLALHRLSIDIQPGHDDA